LFSEGEGGGEDDGEVGEIEVEVGEIGGVGGVGEGDRGSMLVGGEGSCVPPVPNFDATFFLVAAEGLDDGLGGRSLGVAPIRAGAFCLGI